MPVRKVGPNSYQWGNSGKVYSGKGAKAKAERQGRAIYASGYQGAAEEYGAESYKPPASAVANAKRGLKLRKEWGRGGLSPSEAAAQGIDSGVTRARKIASGKVSRHDVRRMSAFNRHRKNYRPDKKMSDGGPTAGTIAWLLWGGTSGVNWAKKKSAAMNAETFEAEDPDDPELLDYMVNVPVLHYYTIGPVEAYNPQDAEDEVVDNWSYWRRTIDNNGDWGGPIWRYRGIDISEPEAYFATEFEASGYQKQKQCAVCLDYAPYNKMMSCFVCGQNYCESCEKYDSCAEYSSEDWGGDPDGPLAKALAKARESLKKPQKPLQITRLPDPNQKTLKDFEADYRPCQKCDNRYKSDCECYCEWCKKDTPLYNNIRGEWVCNSCKQNWDEEEWRSEFEADWQDLPRNELGQWQKPVSVEQLQNLIATTPGVPKLSDLLMLYGGDTPTNRYRLYNDMLTLRITTEDFDDDTVVIDIDNDPEIYYQYILEEPLDIEEQDERLTPEYWDRYSRYLAMTNTPDELEARIEALVSDLDLFNDDDFSEIGVMMAAIRQQKFMEKYQAE
jgi:hypothetical protein